jgi:hypothetical protein
MHDLSTPNIVVHEDGKGTFGVTIHYANGKSDYLTNGMSKDDARKYAKEWEEDIKNDNIAIL